jgi:hypothetical protein
VCWHRLRVSNTRVVPLVPAEQENRAGQDDADASSAGSQPPEALHKVDSASRQRAQAPHRPAKRRVHGRRYYTCAELLRRVYAVDILTCPRCGGIRQLLAAIQDPDSIERVRRAMALPWQAPQLAVARAPLVAGSEACWLTGCRRSRIVAKWGSSGPNRSLNYLHPALSGDWPRTQCCVVDHVADQQQRARSCHRRALAPRCRDRHAQRRFMSSTARFAPNSA